MTAAFEETRPRRRVVAARSQRQGQQKRVVIIGGGFAGIAAAHALRHSDAEVVLIDRRNHHIFQPLLYQVATAVLSPAEIAAPIRQLEAKQRNLSVLLAEVTSVDVASRTIEASCHGRGRPQDRVRFSGGRDGNAPELLRPRRVRAVRAGAQEPQRRGDNPRENPGRVRVGRNDRGRRRARAPDDLCAGRRRTQRRGAGGVLGATWRRSRCGATSAASIRRRPDHSARRRQASSADLCRSLCQKGERAPQEAWR